MSAGASGRRSSAAQACGPQIGAQFQNVLNAFAQGNGQSITGRAYQNLTQLATESVPFLSARPAELVIRQRPRINP